MVKLKETNLDGVKAMARTLLFTDIHQTSLSPIVVQHPFTSSGFNMIMVNGEPKCVDITADSEALHQWRKMVCEQISSAKGKEYGISDRTMNKAKKKLPIKTFRDKGCWYWALDREDG